jgi:hypothetical protein
MRIFKRWLFYHIFKDQIIELGVESRISDLDLLNIRRKDTSTNLSPPLCKLTEGHLLLDLDQILIEKLKKHIVHQTIEQSNPEHKIYKSKIYLWSNKNEKK